MPRHVPDGATGPKACLIQSAYMFRVGKAQHAHAEIFLYLYINIRFYIATVNM